MPEQDDKPTTPASPAADRQDAKAEREQGAGSATATKPAPTRRPPRMLPPWKVLLHNDDVNSMEHVVESIVMLTTLNKEEANVRTQEAHQSGVALLLTTHREKAELVQEQFMSRKLTVTIEPAE